MGEYTKPLPAISSLNRPYWEGLRRRELALQRCVACTKFWYPPAPCCPFCWSRDWSWQKLSGRGRVNSWVAFHRAYFPSFVPDVPYNVAEVELDEGPRLLTNLLEIDIAEIRVGMPVEVVFVDVTEEVTLAKFRPMVRQL
jgi:uncharacterized OB-fold protein